LLKEKLALIYEYNKKSLMFIRAADIQISNNNLQIALDILSDGLKLYPDYPTAYLLLGKILVLQGEYTKAEKAFTKGAEILNNKSTLDYYINDMEKLRSGDSHFTVSRRVSFASDELNELIDENNVNIDEFISGSKPKNKNREFEDRLDDLAKEISGIKIIVDENLPVSEKPAGTIYQDQEIVTETMANIYLSQRKFREAVNIFEKLKIKLPSRNDYFQKKIDEVKMQMNN
jgi:tetratricopeptide (TPR) repeat protein